VILHQFLRYRVEKQASDKQMNNTENSTHVTTVGVGKNKVAIEIIGCVIHCCFFYIMLTVI